MRTLDDDLEDVTRAGYLDVEIAEAAHVAVAPCDAETYLRAYSAEARRRGRSGHLDNLLAVWPYETRAAAASALEG